VRRISDLSAEIKGKEKSLAARMQADKYFGMVLVTPVGAQISTTQRVDSPQLNTARNPTKIVPITALNSTQSRCENASG
jgi:hypothetical protein